MPSIVPPSPVSSGWQHRHQYAYALADMIHSLSSSAQFITTTFRPEMLAKADKFYGVLFSKDKISSIRSIKREEAMQFVEQVGDLRTFHSSSHLIVCA
jgi:hypothetical protein